MFLFDYFYGTKTKACGQEKEDDWVLVDNNEGTLTNSTFHEDYALLEKDEISIDQLDYEPKSQKMAITPTSQIENSKELKIIAKINTLAQEEVVIEVQNQNPKGRIGQQHLKQKIVNFPTPTQPIVVGLVKTEPIKLKNNICKKQAQRRSDKYKGGVWSGKSNDRKSAKCF